jgi:uncharacterized membrane protein YfcA
MLMRVVTAVSGLVTGIAAGFIGVGGGELRIPVLVRVLRFSLHSAAGVNLVVGLFTVALGAYRRLGHSPISDEGAALSWVMGAASIAGAVLGVSQRHRLRGHTLAAVVRTYLVVMGAWMLYESVVHAEHVLMDPSGALRWTLAAVLSFVIAAISGGLGIAGGEMRLPALLYLFGVPIVEAGTVSLLVSIPTVASAAAADRRLGGIPNAVIPVSVNMAVASAVGVLIGAALIPYANRDVIKGVLGALLLASAFRLGGHVPAADQPRAGRSAAVSRESTEAG